jgi:hypothetical protein
VLNNAHKKIKSKKFPLNFSAWPHYLFISSLSPLVINITILFLDGAGHKYIAELTRRAALYCCKKWFPLFYGSWQSIHYPSYRDRVNYCPACPQMYDTVPLLRE